MKITRKRLTTGLGLLTLCVSTVLLFACQHLNDQISESFAPMLMPSDPGMSAEGQSEFGVAVFGNGGVADPSRTPLPTTSDSTDDLWIIVRPNQAQDPLPPAPREWHATVKLTDNHERGDRFCTLEVESQSQPILGEPFQIYRGHEYIASGRIRSIRDGRIIGRITEGGAVEPGDTALVGPLGGGAMLAKRPRQEQPDETTLIPLPLKHTDVHASVAGYIASVQVTQQFHNPFEEQIEAVYQFPLPQDAAVSAFVMTVGPPDNPRRIRGIVREKEEAQALYEAARSQGLNASLLTQVRPNIFEQSIANIEPGQQIDIDITYFNMLRYVDGWYTFVFPMVVGPRFNPPYSDDPVRAVPRGREETPHARGHQNAQGTAIPYLRPDERSGHDIALALDIDAGVSVEAFESPTHAVHYLSQDADDPQAEHKLQVRLNENDRIPNKDFVFRFRVVGEQMKSGLVTHTDAQGNGYFTLMLYPPAELETLERQPMEMIFVLDCSGSMRGEPMAQAKAAMRRALHHLGPDDTFQVIRFSNNASALGNRPLPATPRNIERGLRYLETLEGTGGTMMVEGIKVALDFHHEPGRCRVVTFLTDGKIGNEAEVFREVNARLGDARIFSFGVGSSVNRYLLERLAMTGRGAAAYLLPGDSGNDVMDHFFKRISHPAMADIRLDFGNARAHSVYPARVPDLVVGRSVIITGRYDPAQGELDNLRITGRAGGQDIAVLLSAAQDAAHHPALAQVWARRKIADLMDQMHLPENEDGVAKAKIERSILDTALAFQLMSRYTAFIAVDASRITDGDPGTTVTQPLPIPEGIDYDATVGGGNGE